MWFIKLQTVTTSTISFWVDCTIVIDKICVQLKVISLHNYFIPETPASCNSSPLLQWQLTYCFVIAAYKLELMAITITAHQKTINEQWIQNAVAFLVWFIGIYQLQINNQLRQLIKYFSARCNIYISRLCYDVSVHLSVCDGSALDHATTWS